MPVSVTIIAATCRRRLAAIVLAVLADSASLCGGRPAGRTPNGRCRRARGGWDGGNRNENTVPPDILGATLPALSCLAVRGARAEQPGEYPTHQVTFVVPLRQVAAPISLAHLLAGKLQAQFGKPFTVQNRPGEGTVIATNFVAKSPPDGYTIMMAVSSLAIDATLYKKAALRSGQGSGLLALVASVPFVLVVSPSLPVNSVDDLIKLAKERPLSYGSGGIGAFHHLAAALFAKHDRHQDDPRAVSRHGARR